MYISQPQTYISAPVRHRALRIRFVQTPRAVNRAGTVIRSDPEQAPAPYLLQRRKSEMRLFLAALCLTFIAACTGKPGPDDDLLSTQEFELQEFFDGHVVAFGQFQDVLGTVRRRFEVDINGTWDGQTLTLVEDFVYEDGSTEQRVWSLQQTGEETWEGTAPGVIGRATGVERGDTFNWTYEIDLPVPDGTLRVTFDDWMWQLTPTRVLNKAYMKRFGVDIGEVVITFEKQ